MKKNIKIFLLVFLLLASLSVSAMVFADDDDEREDDDDFPRYQQEESPAIRNIAEPARRMIEATPVVVPDQAVTEEAAINTAADHFLSDADADGIADASDRYLGEDDFAYNLIDDNNNGLADELEALMK